MVTGTASARPRGTIVRSGWNCPGEPTPTASLLTLTTCEPKFTATDPNGYDSEGLVAMKDGTFWVSDEYGPFITHFSRDGRAIQRLSPLDGSLPRELVNRVPNRGLEGLTVTPDGTTLVAMMQSALQQADLNGKNAKNVVPVRIVTYSLRTHAVHEYLRGAFSQTA